MFYKVLCTPLLKLQVLFIKPTSSKLIVTHFEGIAIFDVVFARINETLCPLSELFSFCAIVCLLQIQKHLYHVSKEDVKWLSYLGVEYYLGKIT